MSNRSACCVRPQQEDRQQREPAKFARDLSTDLTATSASFESSEHSFLGMNGKECIVSSEGSQSGMVEAKHLDPVFSSSDLEFPPISDEEKLDDENDVMSDSDGGYSDCDLEGDWCGDSSIDNLPDSKSSPQTVADVVVTFSSNSEPTIQPSPPIPSSSMRDLFSSFRRIALSSDEECDSSSASGEVSDITGFTGDDNRASKKLPGKVKKGTSVVVLDRLPSCLGSSHLSLVDRKRTTRVKFGRVYLRKYRQIICDNPACSSGPAVGIGWEYREYSKSAKIDEWEAAKKKRVPIDLMLTREERFAMAARLGYSKKDVAQMIRSITRARNQRRQTVNNIPVHKVEEAVESVGRKFKNFLKLAKKVEPNHVVLK